MNSTIVGAVALLSAIAGGVIGSLVTLGLHGAPERSTPPREETGEYDVEIQGLRDEIGALQRKVGLLSRAQGHVSPTQPSGSAGAGGGAENDGAEAAADPWLEVAVRDIVERMDSERDGVHGPTHARRGAAPLAERLGLSEEQKRQFQKINVDHLAAIRELRLQQDQGTPLPRSERRKRMTDLRRKADDSLRAILTPEQLQIYDGLEEGGRVGSGSGWQRFEHSGTGNRQR